jgi:hypothetical protein
VIFMEDELGAMAAYSRLLSKEFKCPGVRVT